MPTQPTFTCATCDVQIGHHPVFHLGLAFCCAGCAADGPCMCSYDVEVPSARVVVPAQAAPVPPAAAVSRATPERVHRPADGRRRVDDRPLIEVSR